MLLKNVTGTSQESCSCDSWLDHWERFSGQTATFCGEKSCINKDLVGAHVRKVDGTTKVYIFPLCSQHNKESGILTCVNTYKLVSADKSETCEKPTKASYLPRRF
jgi:hypothetical protein